MKFFYLGLKTSNQFQILLSISLVMYQLLRKSRYVMHCSPEINNFLHYLDKKEAKISHIGGWKYLKPVFVRNCIFEQQLRITLISTLNWI